MISSLLSAVHFRIKLRIFFLFNSRMQSMTEYKMFVRNIFQAVKNKKEIPQYTKPLYFRARDGIRSPPYPLEYCKIKEVEHVIHVCIQTVYKNVSCFYIQFLDLLTDNDDCNKTFLSCPAFFIFLNNF